MDKRPFTSDNKKDFISQLEKSLTKGLSRLDRATLKDIIENKKEMFYLAKYTKSLILTMETLNKTLKEDPEKFDAQIETLWKNENISKRNTLIYNYFVGPVVLPSIIFGGLTIAGVSLNPIGFFGASILTAVVLNRTEKKGKQELIEQIVKNMKVAEVINKVAKLNEEKTDLKSA